MPHAVQVRIADGLASRPAAVPDAVALRRLLAKAVRAALRQQQVRDAEISVALLADDEIQDMNHRYLGHAEVTDVISFALYGDGEVPVGDVYVGFEQAQRQAESAGVDLREELVRLAVHGILHVLGHDHPAGAERVESAMWQVQEEIVQGMARG
jgi:probable rRNA maturation factor